jgi:hypothetical protein
MKGQQMHRAEEDEEEENYVEKCSFITLLFDIVRGYSTRFAIRILLLFSGFDIRAFDIHALL